MSGEEIVDGITMKRAITRITYEIIERNRNIEDLVLVGIKTRGVFIANRIGERLKQIENFDISVGELDTKPFRDDLSEEYEDTSKMEPIAGREIILVDDVLYTGRPIRAAMEAVIHKGRPSKISLAVLVDRGHRELPIRADYVGKNIPTAVSEEIIVEMEDSDGQDRILINLKNDLMEG